MENKIKRIAEKHRVTKETDVFVKCNLDWNWIYKINTWIRFFDHMLEQLSRHSMIDLEIKVIWDIDVDEHHTIEDTWIVLWEVLLEAIWNKKWINRYAFAMTPMDWTLVETAIDICNRQFLVFNVEFSREMVWNFPTEMVEHFFNSFASGLKATLHINNKYSENTHHLIEWIFKAVAITLKDAVYVNPRNKWLLPTTKWQI